MTDRYLKGRGALVTGGATGQGRAIANALAERGCNVAIGSRLAGEGRSLATVFTHLPDRETFDGVIAEIESHGVAAVGADHDLRSSESCAALYRSAIDTFGQVDILCNVAGVYSVHPICGHDDEDWHRTIDINLSGAYRMTKLALPGMIERGWGRIVNIASTAANVGQADNAAYCASKAGLLGLTRCVALEGAPHGVTCNAINPGYVDTGMMDASFAGGVGLEEGEYTLAEAKAAFAENYPQKRMIEPAEIGALVAFLCSDGARGLTMEDITLAGGGLW